ncbi:MAG: hypothetical protein O3C63_08125 [Cyanobacteria bacterium]|nr:hypothetical protein [Cyanobacteriota bacterium]MDA1020093.1 hypothetical protein [Cyanobacteriota bacterium]
MTVEPVKARTINTDHARNETLAAKHYSNNIDNHQRDQAGLEDSYQSYILGGNRFELADYSTDAQSLTHQIAIAMNLRTENSQAQKEAWALMNENQKARGSDSMMQLGKG